MKPPCIKILSSSTCDIYTCGTGRQPKGTQLLLLHHQDWKHSSSVTCYQEDHSKPQQDTSPGPNSLVLVSKLMWCSSKAGWRNCSRSKAFVGSIVGHTWPQVFGEGGPRTKMVSSLTSQSAMAQRRKQSAPEHSPLLKKIKKTFFFSSWFDYSRNVTTLDTWEQRTNPTFCNPICGACSPCVWPRVVFSDGPGQEGDCLMNGLFYFWEWCFLE